MWVYYNPVRIVFGAGTLEELPALLGGRRYALVTYPDDIFASLTERLAAAAGKPLAVVDDVAPNPDFELLANQVGRLREATERPEVLVALGGGSVIDTVKVLAAANGNFDVVRRFLKSGENRERLGSIPIIAVPTTAGTGSEVTCWGTVWDAAGGAKHSLSLPQLFPEAAVIDPELMVAKPRVLTVATGLDALSHALESLWNKNVNPVSMTFAVSAAQQVLTVLPQLVEDRKNLELRAAVARASLYAGMAFSNTKTAIAHSLSYPITLRFGVAHGIACSFTLPMVLKSVAELEGLGGDGLRTIFGDDLRLGAERLADFLHDLGIATDPAAYGIVADEWDELVGAAFAGERGQNFIGSRKALLDAMALPSPAQAAKAGPMVRP